MFFLTPLCIITTFGTAIALSGFSNAKLSNSSILSNQRSGAISYALQSDTGAVLTEKDKKQNPYCASLTWLEGNSWLWNVNGVKILVDPIFDTLDFGMPFLYKADKKVLNDYQSLIDRMAKEADHILLTQGLPDHCCSKTLPKLAELMSKSARVVAPLSAKPVLSRSFSKDRITYAKPGDTIELFGSGTTSITINTIKGALVGPPTQDPENGYILRSSGASQGGIFIEPHCMWQESDINGLSADVIVTPTYGQRFGPNFLHYTVLHSGSRAVELAKLLGAMSIVTFENANPDAAGILTKVLTQTGNKREFEQLTVKSGMMFIEAVPGEPMDFLCKNIV